MTNEAKPVDSILHAKASASLQEEIAEELKRRDPDEEEKTDGTGDCGSPGCCRKETST